ncbi:MAG: transcriptional regulator/antitoxin, MazE [Candidatus Poribacteria bacterium]|nr:transcriptional regulator/antitoxin, MazE [Candidatus Poribacteria bacterium]
MKIKVQKIENSDGIYFSKKMLEEAQMNVGDEVQITIQNGRIVVETATQARRRTDLQALLAKMPKDYEPEETDWGKPVGKEVW